MVGDLDELGQATVALLPVVGSLGDRGTVWSFAPEMNNSGPRSGLSVSTFASVHGLTFATAAWNSGAPGTGGAYAPPVPGLRLIRRSQPHRAHSPGLVHQRPLPVRKLRETTMVLFRVAPGSLTGWCGVGPVRCGCCSA
jgi:hypothetical protein